MFVLQLIYGGMEPAWSYSAFYDYNDHNRRHELDPQFTQDYITRDMKPVSHLPELVIVVVMVPQMKNSRRVHGMV